MSTATNKTVISNETGQYNLSPIIVTDLMQVGYDLKMPYLIWFDGDGLPSLALHDNSGNLRPNGLAFKNFIATHY
ncbi:MAG: hypothetical protein JST52_07905 [Bacteroidetes bacterium]|nr:hypothetical protein [Bacteroidota bacterium]MBS1740872.1 hypothetical protein [Bacteroidota bacterium]